MKPLIIFVSVIHSGHAQAGVQELEFLTHLVGKEQLKPVIDRCYSFEEMIEAHRYVDKGHKKGNVVIKVNEITNEY
ncbi:MAG: zinc-binding dehydrogenase [Cohnella sp.]|nr:zinc-binding dehydrogenase [Cohnella sp.]